MTLNMCVTVIFVFPLFPVDKYHFVIEIHAWAHLTAQRTYRLAYEICFIPHFAFQFQVFSLVGGCCRNVLKFNKFSLDGSFVYCMCFFWQDSENKKKTRSIA